jgi:hypothetical protein
MDNKKIASQLLKLAKSLVAEVSEQEFQDFVVTVQQLASKNLKFNFDRFARVHKYEISPKGSKKVIAYIIHYVGAAIKVEYDVSGLSNRDVLNAGLKLELDNPTPKEAAVYLGQLLVVYENTKTKKG